jgi:DNA (cytosine-5)-methyltransferase 1
VTSYYNENDPFAAAWLRELISDNLIANGVVDERSIEDVLPSDLAGFTQCHFFAGIGGWSYALRLAGVPDDYPVWTGSCPCQPFSAAGQGKGFADERHLWPAFFHLVVQCRPGIVFGEQVEAAINHGWIDLVQDDMEGEGYAFWAVGLPAASVSAPHVRQRLWWVANNIGEQRGQVGAGFRRSEEGSSAERLDERLMRRSVIGMADSGGARLEEHSQQQARGQRASAERSGEVGSMVIAQSEQMGLSGFARKPGSAVSELGVTDSDGRQPGSEAAEAAGHWSSVESAGFWDNVRWILCRDGKHRPIPVEPALFPLANGIPNRVGLLRGAGNAIVPQVAAEFIRACVAP